MRPSYARISMTGLQLVRAKSVLEILKKDGGFVGPTEIARRIDEPWCVYGLYPQSAPVCYVLKALAREGLLIKEKGKYSLINDSDRSWMVNLGVASGVIKKVL